MDYIGIATSIVEEIAPHIRSKYKEKTSFINARNQVINDESLYKIVPKELLTNAIGSYCDETIYKEFKKDDILKNIKLLYNGIVSKLIENNINAYLSKYIAITVISIFLEQREQSSIGIQINDKDSIYKFIVEEKNIYKDLVKNEIKLIDTITDGTESVLSVYDIEERISRKTRKPQLNLSFFKTDDYEFINSFKNVLNQDIICISSRNKEETLLYILNQLVTEKISENVFVVTNSEIWEKLIRSDIEEFVFIPYFSADEIIPIKNNKTIFIKTDSDINHFDNCIELRKRTNNDLIECLRNYGLDSEKAYKLVEETNGFYFPMKTRITDSQIKFSNKLEEEFNVNILNALIICEKWEDNEYDNYILERLSGETIQTIKEEIEKIINKENDVLLKYSLYGDDKYSIVCFEDLWNRSSYNLKESQIDKAINLYKEVLFENGISKRLKDGFTNTMQYLSSLKDNYDSYDKKYDDLVFDILYDAIKSNKIDLIIPYIVQLCEISPKAFIVTVKDSLENSNGNLVKWYKQSYNYTYLLSALELLFVFEDYCESAIEILFKLNNYEIKYFYSNSPFETLTNAFCAWHNITILNNKKKLELLEKYLIKNYKTINILYECLPGIKSSMIGSARLPHYKEYAKIEEVKRKDMMDLYSKYIDLFVEYSKNDINVLIKILDIIYLLDDNKCVSILSKIIISVNNLSDREKLIVKEKLRDEIHKNRFFIDSEWAVTEERIELYEKYFYQIEFSNKLYDYLYLVDDEYKYKLLNPIPYSKEDTKRYDNYKLIDSERKEKFDKFKKEKLSIEEYIKLINKKKYNQLGFCLAKYFDNSIFNKQTFYLIINEECNEQIVYDYFKTTYKNDQKLLSTAIEIINNSKVDNKNTLIATILKFEDFNKIETNDLLIEKQKNEIKNIYWKNRSYFSCESKKVSDWALNECVKFGSVSNYLHILTENIKLYSNDDLYNLLCNIEKINIKDFESDLAGYNLSKCLKRLIDDNIDEIDKIEKLSSIELSFNDQLDWNEMNFTKVYLERSPKLLSEIINNIYENKNINNNDTHSIENEYSLIMFKFKFCPACINDNVEYKELKIWCNEFKKSLIGEKAEDSYYHYLGKYLSYSPAGEDGIIPCEAVRKLIEEEKNDRLAESYQIEVFNSRGVYSPTAGRNEKELASYYLNFYNTLKSEYPFTAKIYKKLYHIYNHEAENGRIEAEYDSNY